MKLNLVIGLLILTFMNGYSQRPNAYNANKWADSVFRTLSPDEKIAQLMVVRVSSINSSRQVVFYQKEVEEAIRQYNIGGICLFQGGPQKQASLVNQFQSIAKTPLLVSIDAENGVGMRFDSVQGLPRQMMLGAVQDQNVIYQYGRVVGAQCVRSGIQVNYAPVVDINNNPANPVINDRSFGEDKHKVALYGMLYMKGMQSLGVMACAKHFPGHGDVSVDSHLDLPVVDKSRKELDSMELYPFRMLAEAGVQSMMVAHLHLPQIDNTRNRATSVSKKAVSGILREDMGYKGLIFTDALEMKGVSKFFKPGELSAEALIAGNDILCLPEDIPASIQAIKSAIQRKKLTWKDIDGRVKKLLVAKYQHGLGEKKTIELANITEDLNKDIPEMRRRVAEHALTLLRNEDKDLFPLAHGKRVAYVGVGLKKDNAFARLVRENYDAQVYYFDYSLDASKVEPFMELIKGRYDMVVIGLHQYNRFPARNFGVSDAAVDLVKKLQEQYRTATFAFGNPYLLANFSNSRVLVACYDDDEITQQTAADLLLGRFTAKGKLPVSVSPALPAGSGIVEERFLQEVRASEMGFNESHLMTIDSVVEDAIQKKAIPGAVVLVAKDGKIAYEKSFGYQTYEKKEPVYPETIYDLASVTKIMATTVSVMKLYEEGKLNLDAPLGQYLSWVRGSDKENIKIRDLLLHRAGLQAWIPFYKETVDPRQKNAPFSDIYSYRADVDFPVRVADHMFMRRDWLDTIDVRILKSPVSAAGKYIYSDLDFIFLGRVVEAISGKSLEDFTEENFYRPLEMWHTSFRPRYKFPLSNIAPTENEEGFRRQLLKGDVHDPGAAMFGGISGHAGLFSTAYDIAVLSQVLLNGGTYRGRQFLKKETIDYFNSYYDESRRGLGFDKPDQENYKKDEPYPTRSASPQTFGHTGFTGTCVWIDPVHDLIYIFLSNRVHNNGDANRFLRMNVRPKVHEIIYESLKTGSVNNPGIIVSQQP